MGHFSNIQSKLRNNTLLKLPSTKTSQYDNQALWFKRVFRRKYSQMNLKILKLLKAQRQISKNNYILRAYQFVVL